MKRLGIAALAIALTVGLTACGAAKGGTGGAGDSGKAASTASSGSGGSGGSSNGQVVTIRTNILSNEISKDEIAAFEKANPNIKIQLETTDDTKLAAELATGDAPDIIRVVGTSDLPSYVIKGIAMNLTDKIDHSTVIKKDDLLPVANVYRFDGKAVGSGPIYGLPKDWSPDFTIFYNKKLFDAAHIPLPDASKPMTWTQVVDLAKKLTIKNGSKVTQYGLTFYDGKTEAEYPMMMQYLDSAGEDVNSSDFNAVDFNKPAVQSYLNLWKNAVAANIGPNSVNNDTTDGISLFMGGKSAMIVAGYWFSGLIRGDAKAKTHLDDYGMLPAPIAEGGQRVSPTGSATGAIIYKGTKHPEEAWKVFEWFFAGQPAVDRAKSGWGVPIFKSLLPDMPNQTSFDKQTYNQLQEEMKYSDSYLKMNPYLTNANTLIQKYMNPVYFNKSTLQDAISGITKDANVMIKESIQASSNQ